MMLPADNSHTRLRLRADRALLHEEGACLPLRSRHGRCTACAGACPSGALAVTIDAVRLSDACTGCGRCAAACPTQALALPELEALPAAPSTPLTIATTVRIECRMVPADRLAPGTTVLPCLGALTPGMLLAQAAAGGSVDVIDRGWCLGCPAAGTPPAEAAKAVHPADGALDAAALWMQVVTAESAGSAGCANGADPAGQPAPTVSLRPEPLPAALRPMALPPAPPLPEPVDRRRFFRAALAKPAGRDRPGDRSGATPMGGDGRAAYPADARRPSPERARQLAALQAMALAHDTAVPAEFFPSLHADARCCDRRMCVALCPTAALTVADDGASTRLRFDPARCIACGTCERACPEAALALAPHGGAAQVQTLAIHRRERCAGCGDVFTPSPGDTAATEVGTGENAGSGESAAHAEAARPLCPTCTKSRRFMADARRQLFGALN